MLSPEQQALRRTGISGSNLATILGENPWASAVDVFEFILGLRDNPIPEWDAWGHFPIVRGRIFERPIMELYAMMYHRRVNAANRTLVWDKNPLVIATPDGVSAPAEEPPENVKAGHEDEACVVEIKSPSWRMRSHWGEEYTDEVPNYYLCQAMMEMAVTGHKMAHVVPFFDEPLLYRVHWDGELFEGFVECIERFWKDHILARRPPPPDGSESYRDYLGRAYPQDRFEDYLEAEPEDMEKIRELAELSDQEAALAARRELLTQQLKARIADRPGIAGDWGRIDWKQSKEQICVKHKQLHAAVGPEMLAQFTYTRPGNRPFTPRLKKAAFAGE